MRSLKALDDKIEFIGIGGERMKQEGLESLFPIKEISKMGIIDPLLSLNTILKRRKQLISFFESQKPDIFIGIDSPSFNLGISKKLKQKTDISTIQYVCPQFWAWREDRIKSFSKFLMYSSPSLSAYLTNSQNALSLSAPSLSLVSSHS